MFHTAGSNRRAFVEIGEEEDHSIFRIILAGWFQRLACLGFALAALALSSRAASDTTPWGQPVAGINVTADAQLTLDQFKSEITQKIGEPLDRTKVAQSLKNLYETGRFRELRADVEEKPYGVVLVFVGRAQYFIGLVRVEGAPKRIEPTTLISATRLRLGEPIVEDGIKLAQQRIATVLVSDGFHQAKVDAKITHHADDQEWDILFLIDPGRQARLSEVEVQGHPGVSPRRLASVAHWRRGTHLTSDRLDNGLLRIHKFYIKRRNLQATASVENRSYDPKDNTEKLILRVEAGPEVHVHIRGAHLSAHKLRHILPVYREGATDELALEQGERKLEEYRQEQGYFSAKVRSHRATSADSGKMDITYNVTPGPRGEFVGFAFHGNESVDEDDLEAVMKIQPRAFPRYRGTYNRAFLDHDVKAMTILYQSRGFPEVRITPQVDEHYGHKAGNLFITFNIEEGPLVKVAQLSLKGLNPEAEKSFHKTLLTRQGEPFSPARAQTDKETVLTYLGNQGYAHALVNWKTSPPSAAHEVNVEYTIDTGPRETIREIIVMGNQHTRDKLVDRELTFDEGQALNQSELLESQQRLYDLGVFNQVQIATQDPESPEANKTVLVSVEEAKRWTLVYGFGFDLQSLGNNQPRGQTSVSPRGSLGVTRLNMFGRAQTFTARGRISNLETGVTLSYLVPRFARRRDLNLRLTGIAERSRDVATFTFRRQEGNFIVTKQFSPKTFLSGRYTYRRVEALDISQRISREQLPLLGRPVRVALLGSSYGNDHRDNPADATRGSYSLLDAGVAWTGLGSEADFLRFSGQNATYYKLWPRLIFARNTRIGVESPFGGLRQVTTPQGPVFTRDIPLPEKFFMGGSEAHRAFGLNQAGPRDPATGFPIGGRALLLNTFELRIPFGRNRFGLVLFHDAGNVYSSVRKMRFFKFSQSSPGDFDYNVHAAGIGLRYQTPVGPVRFDFAYSLNPPRFRVCQDTNNPQSCLNTGQGFRIDQLPHFQFFVSLGQSF